MHITLILFQYRWVFGNSAKMDDFIYNRKSILSNAVSAKENVFEFAFRAKLPTSAFCNADLQTRTYPLTELRCCTETRQCTKFLGLIRATINIIFNYEWWLRSGSLIVFILSVACRTVPAGSSSCVRWWRKAQIWLATYTQMAYLIDCLGSLLFMK